MSQAYDNLLDRLLPCFVSSVNAIRFTTTERTESKQPTRPYALTAYFGEQKLLGRIEQCLPGCSLGLYRLGSKELPTDFYCVRRARWWGDDSLA